MINSSFLPGLLFWISIVFVSGFLCGSCYGNVTQLLHLNGTDQRMPNEAVISAISGTSLLSCGVRCTRDAQCLSVSYHQQNRTCELGSSSGHDAAVARVPATGWKIYRLQYDCPNSASGFIKVGSMILKVCSNKVTKQKAKAACDQFGRLVKINTVAKMTALRDHLAGFPGDVWINGYRSVSGLGDWGGGGWGGIETTSVYRFGTWELMPPCGNATFWYNPDCGVDDCVVLDQSVGFRMADDVCGALHGYVCEMV